MNVGSPGQAKEKYPACASHYHAPLQIQQQLAMASRTCWEEARLANEWRTRSHALLRERAENKHDPVTVSSCKPGVLS
jgi:hypothetical protein